MGHSWEQSPLLTGPSMRLTPLRRVDAADFFAALGPPEVAAEVLAHLAYGPPASVEAAADLLAAAEADPDRWAYGQRISATGEFVGTTSFYEIRPEVRALAIGHTWVARHHWRTAVNTESKLIMMGHAFDELGAERIVWHTDSRNLRSQAAIERLGAQREGVLRHHRIRRDGSWRDTVQYSMLAAEWPEVQRRLRRRMQDN